MDSFSNIIYHELPLPVREQAMTIAEMWIKQGKEQGIQQGIEKGMEQGVRQAKSEIIKKLWDATHDYTLIAKVSNLIIDEVKTFINTDSH